MRTAFCHCGVVSVVDGEEDVCCASEIGESGFELEGIGGLHEHEGHGGAEEDDLRFRVVF